MSSTRQAMLAQESEVGVYGMLKEILPGIIERFSEDSDCFECDHPAVWACTEDDGEARIFYGSKENVANIPPQVCGSNVFKCVLDAPDNFVPVLFARFLSDGEVQFGTAGFVNPMSSEIDQTRALAQVYQNQLDYFESVRNWGQTY
jgi:hypothetical protein